MLRPAFSTVACPSWTLDRVAASAGDWGYLGVELRSFGQGGTDFACDPGLTDGVKVRRLFADAGVEVCGVASGVRFDAPVFPPVIGHILPAREASIREGKHMISVARDCGAPFMRVFAFEVQGREGRRSVLRRVCDRIYKVCDFARNRDVRVVIENGGTFARAEDLIEIMDRVRLPQLAACYDGTTAWQAGEDPAAGVAAIGPRLAVARLRDLRENRPARLGTGEAPCREFVQSLRACDETWGNDPWLVYTWDRAWLPELAPAEEVLPKAAQLIFDWSGQVIGRRKKFEAFQSAAPAMML